jgi:hypothetical protein
MYFKRFKNILAWIISLSNPGIKYITYVRVFLKIWSTKGSQYFLKLFYSRYLTLKIVLNFLHSTDI